MKKRIFPSDTTTTFEFATYYKEKGFSVIPISAWGKKPLISWKEFQKRIASDGELEPWFGSGENNIGIVTGEVSGIAVVDLDSDEAIAFAKEHRFFDNTPRVKTSKGYHLYFKFIPGLTNFQGRSDLPNIDLRGEGGFVVAPPSVHESGHAYSWNEGKSPDDLPLGQFPEILLTKESGDKQSIAELLKTGSKKGSRNNDTARVAGHYANEGLSLDDCIDKTMNWNQKNSPPLSDDEVVKTVESIFARHKHSGGKRKGPNAATQLVQIFSAEQYYYFHDELGEPFVRFESCGNYQVHHVNSNKFKSFVRKVGYDNLGSPLKDTVVHEVIGVLSAKATFDGQQHALAYRSAKTNACWIDLGNGKSDAVMVDKEEWKIVSSKDVPVLFRRNSHMCPLPIPELGGNIEDLKQLIHISNPEIWILLKVWLVTAFIPDIPRPALVLHGLHGAGKSVTATMLRALLDPSHTTLLPMPSNHDEFAQQINNHYLIALDNLQYLKPWASDAICRAITGGAFSKRKLYTDHDDVIFRFQRLFIINGISNPASASDLLDRSILIELDRVPESKRLTERDIRVTFESLAPGILGAIFDALSITLKTEHDYKPSDLPRMADWARLGYAAAEALGIGGEVFIEAYRNNTKLQHNEVIFSDPVAAIVAKLAEEKKELIGTPTEIFVQCRGELDDDEKKTKTWPKTVSHFVRRLKLVSHNLRELGVEVEISRKKERQITIKYKA